MFTATHKSRQESCCIHLLSGNGGSFSILEQLADTDLYVHKGMQEEIVRRLLTISESPKQCLQNHLHSLIHTCTYGSVSRSQGLLFRKGLPVSIPSSQRQADIEKAAALTGVLLTLGVCKRETSTSIDEYNRVEVSLL